MTAINIEQIVAEEIDIAIGLAQRDTDISRIPFEYLKQNVLPELLKSLVNKYPTTESTDTISTGLIMLARTYFQAYQMLLGFMWNTAPHDYTKEDKQNIAHGLSIFYSQLINDNASAGLDIITNTIVRTIVLAKEIGQKRLPLQEITAENVKLFLSEKYHARFPASAPALTRIPSGNPTTSYGAEVHPGSKTGRGELLPFASG